MKARKEAAERDREEREAGSMADTGSTCHTQRWVIRPLKRLVDTG